MLNYLLIFFESNFVTRTVPNTGDTEGMSGSQWAPLQNVEKSCHGAFTQGCDCGAGGAEGATECPVGACSDLVRLAEAQ